jgi:hypothetical protein
MKFFEEEKSHEKSNKKVSTKVIQKILEKIKKKMSAADGASPTEIASAPYRRDGRRLPRPRPLVVEERGGRPASRRR